MRRVRLHIVGWCPLGRRVGSIAVTMCLDGDSDRVIWVSVVLLVYCRSDVEGCVWSAVYWIMISNDVVGVLGARELC